MRTSFFFMWGLAAWRQMLLRGSRRYRRGLYPAPYPSHFTRARSSQRDIDPLQTERARAPPPKITPAFPTSPCHLFFARAAPIVRGQRARFRRKFTCTSHVRRFGSQGHRLWTCFHPDVISNRVRPGKIII